MNKIERLHSGVQAGPVSRIALARTSNYTTPLLFGEQAIIAAATSPTGELTLYTWKIDLATGRLTQAQTTSSGHAASRHSIADSVLPVVALRELSGGKLRIMAFGDADHAGSSDVHTATSSAVVDDLQLGMCSDLSKGGCIVAFNDGAGVLTLERWQLGHGTSMKRLASSGDQGVPARFVTITIGYGLVVTAFRGSDDDLKLVLWSVFLPDKIHRVGGSQDDAAGAVGEIALTAFPLLSPPEYPFMGAFIVTAVRDSHGQLRVINWQIDVPSDNVIRRISTYHQGRHITEVAVASFETATHQNVGVCVVAVRDDSGHLKLISFRVPTDGQIAFLANSDGEPTEQATQVAVVGVSADLMVTAHRDADGNLKLVSWRVTHG